MVWPNKPQEMFCIRRWNVIWVHGNRWVTTWASLKFSVQLTLQAHKAHAHVVSPAACCITCLPGRPPRMESKFFLLCIMQVWQGAPGTAAAVSTGGTEAQHPELDNILEEGFNTVDALGIHQPGSRAYQVNALCFTELVCLGKSKYEIDAL